MKKIRVVTVDDSALMSRMLKSAIQTDPTFELVGQAFDAGEARDLIKTLNPDVITLDVEMPGMNGLQFLERLMAARPMPVVMFSSHTGQGAEITLHALELGAVDFQQKPRSGLDKAMTELSTELLPKLKVAASVQVRPMRGALSQLNDARHNKSHIAPTSVPMVTSCDVIAIGASTGGVTAIREVLEHLPNTLPPIVITQHMPDGYTDRFADRLSRVCNIKVKEAAQGDILKAGHAYIAPGNQHLHFNKTHSGEWQCELSHADPVSGHRPSVDFMFSSIADHFKSRAIGIILTGMGRDGAEGLLKMRKAGARTIGQDAASAVVYGMPRAAFEGGAVETQYALEKIAPALIDLLSSSSKKVANS